MHILQKIATATEKCGREDWVAPKNDIFGNSSKNNFLIKAMWTIPTNDIGYLRKTGDPSHEDTCWDSSQFYYFMVHMVSDVHLFSGEIVQMDYLFHG